MSEIDLQRQIEELYKRVDNLERVEPYVIACRVYNDAAFTHNSTGNYLAVTFNSERWDATGMHSTSTNTSRITIAAAGWYALGGGIVIAANTTGVRRLAIRLGGSVYIAVNQLSNLANAEQYLAISSLYYIAADNYAELMVYQNSGGNLDISSSSAFTPEFWAIRLP